MKNLIMTAALLAGLSGCVTVTLPPDRWTRLDATLQDAHHLGASNLPAAQLYLKMAMDERSTAQRFAADGNERASLMLARAQSDASLAVALAHESAVHRSMERADEALRTVHQQVESESGGTR